MQMNKPNFLLVLLVPSVVLLIPLVAMWIKADGWAWTAADFCVAWLFLAGVLMAYQLIARNAATRAYRAATGLALGTGLTLLWLNGAVGLIGSEDNPANLLYVGVLGVGLIGAVIARLDAAAMARALYATALAQLLVPVVALAIWRPDFSPGVIQVFALNFVFVLLFTGAGILFKRAAAPHLPWQSPTRPLES